MKRVVFRLYVKQSRWMIKYELEGVHNLEILLDAKEYLESIGYEVRIECSRK